MTITLDFLHTTRLLDALIKASDLVGDSGFTGDPEYQRGIVDLISNLFGASNDGDTNRNAVAALLGWDV